MRRISKDAPDGFHFLTFTVRRWFYIFDRHDRWRILADALAHARENKGVEVCAYVFMLNHIHMIVSASDAAAFVHGFKRHTARKILDNIAAHEPDLLPLFAAEGGGFRLWKESNAPVRVESLELMRQKARYIENNPVKKGYVVRPEHWLWSSACPDSPVRVTRDW